ncbi:MAG: phage tail protein [Gammaproteobacteria bacterium]|nr:phage tail protein [Gammaproteobacteria bacterium]
MPKAITAVVAVVKAITATKIGKFALYIATNYLLGKISAALAGKRAARSGIDPQLVTVRDTTASRAIIYGEARTGGTVVYYGTSGSRNQYLWYVVAVAGHQVESITDIWIDNERITNAQMNNTTGEVTGVRFAGYLHIWKVLGTSNQTVQTDINAAVAEWGSTFYLRGIAYVVFRLTLNTEVWQSGAPQNFYFLVKGRRVYDPRKDSTNGGSGSHRLNDATTWEWSDNPVLCQADYLTGGSIYYNTATPNRRYGLRVDPALIDWAQVSSAANVCDQIVSTPGGDQKRYRCSGVFLPADEPHEEIMQALADAYNGPLPLNYSGKFRIFAGQYSTPSISIGDNDLTEKGYEIRGSVPYHERYNATIAEYVDPARDYQFVTCAMQTNASYEAEDGRRAEKNFRLRAVSDEYQAQRYCYSKLLQSRNQTSVVLHLGLNGMVLTPWSTFNLTLTEQGWTNKVFRVLQMDMDFDERQVIVTAQEDSSASWADPPSYGSPGSGASGTVATEPDAVGEFTATGQIDGITFRWTFPASYTQDTVAVLYEHTSASPFSSATQIWAGAATSVTIAKTDTTTRYYWVRLRATLNKYGPRTPSGDGMPAAASSISTGFRATASPTSVGKVGTTSSLTSNATTVTPVNGTSPYTYSWSPVSGDTAITTNSPTSATTTFTRTGLAVDETVQAVRRCTVTDSTSATATVDVTVTFTRISTS